MKGKYKIKKSILNTQIYYHKMLNSAKFGYYYNMRIDKFLNTVNITKRRAVSEDMCKSGVVSINSTVAKPSKEVKIGDIITIKFISKEVSYEVLELPMLKTIPKSEQGIYVRAI